MMTKAQKDEVQRLALLSQQQLKQETKCVRRWTEDDEEPDEEEETFFRELNFNRD